MSADSVAVGKTLERRVLGAMNDHAFTAQHIVARAGGLARASADEINHALHRIIYSLTGYTPPIEAVLADC
jgi:hypothetical protein